MLRRAVGPDLPITVAQAKANGRIDGDAEDALIETYIKAALAHAEKWTGVAFQAQTWELLLDAFPAHEVELPLGPVMSITSVSYVDADGVTQTTADYEVDLTPPERGWIIPTGDWPATMETVNAVTIRFVVGNTPPDDVVAALLLLTEHFYENRAASGEEVSPIPFGVEAILNLHRRLFV